MKYLPIPILQSQSFLGYLAAFIAGIFLPFAFAPFNYSLLAIISPALLLGLWFNVTPREAFWRGWWYGLGSFGVGISWIYISIHYYGNTPIVVAGVFTFLFVAFLALFPAVQGYFLQWCFPNKSLRAAHDPIFQRGYILKALLYFPASWTLVEWIRSWILTGFPWLQLGHSQVSSYLSGFIPLGGVFGVTVLVTFLSGLLYLLYEQKLWAKKIILLLMILIVFSLGAVLKPVQWTIMGSNPLSVSLVQGNIPQALKWSQAEQAYILKLYPTLSQSIWKSSDLVIWPEAAVTLPIPWSLSYLNDVLKAMQAYPVSLITGIPMQAQNSWNYYNAMVLLSRSGVDVYYKRYLVPFGEYVPFEKWLRGIVGFFDLPMSDFIAGTKGSQIDLQNHQNFIIAPFICYEIAYPDAILTTVPKANLMVVISNDTWFGNSLAPCQHLQIAEFAARAAGRYLLFSTNDGITAIIDPMGRVVTSAPRFKQAILSSKVFLTTGNTPWVIWGHNYLIIVLGLIIILGTIFRKT